MQEPMVLWESGLKSLPFSVQVLLVLSIGLVFRTGFTACYRAFFHPLASIPGPKLAKFSKHYLALAQLRGTRAQTVDRLHSHYGPVVRVGPNEVSISDWRAYRNIYNNKFSRKSDSFYTSGQLIREENLFSMRDKAMHSSRRKMESQPFSQQAIKENELLITAKARTMVNRMQSHATSAADGKTVDVYTLCGLFSLEVILQCAFNHSCGEAIEGSSKRYLQAMDESASCLPISAALPFIKTYGIGRHIPGFVGRAYRALDSWEEHTARLLDDFERAWQPGDKSQRFMAAPILREVDEFQGRKLTRQQAVEEAMGLAFAGSGTTSTTLLYLMFRMSTPEMSDEQSRLRAELDESRKANQGSLALETLQSLPFLNAVIKETLRLHPTIISTLPRTMETELIVHDVKQARDIIIAKGVDVGMQNYVHHRDAELFPQPDEFRPARWLSTRASELHDALTPFSLGQRNCIGQNLAWAELRLAVAEIFTRVRLQLSEKMEAGDMEMEDRFNIAPRGKKLILKLESI